MPDDEWYELKGSEAGKEETIQNFEVTYYRPEGKKMDVQWISSDGRNGWVDYLSAYHTQDYYYPAWIFGKQLHPDRHLSGRPQHPRFSNRLLG